MRFDGDTMTLPPTRFSLGGSPVEIDAKVASFQKPVVDYHLRSSGVRLASLGFAGEGIAKEEVVRNLEAEGHAEMTGASPLARGTVRSSAGSLRDVEFQNLDVAFGLREQVATLDKLALRAYQGSYAGSGRYDMREAENPKFSFRSDVRDMDLAGLLGAKVPAAAQRIEGKLFADVDLAGSGKGWETIQQTLRGQGRMDVKDGMLKDVNLAESVLSGVTGVPGLSNFISPRIRRKYPDIFGTGDTRFDKLGGSVQIADGRADTRDLEITARDYSIRGEGVYELRNQLDFKATLFASRELSQDIIDDVKEAKYLAGPDGRIEIPFRARGALPSVKPMPDASIIQKAIGRAVVDKGLEKLFGKPKREDRPPPPYDPDAPEPAPTKRLKPEQELLKRGLEGLFKKR
jgi:AsmA protein